MFCITKKFRFEAAHALLNYDGLCKNIHGHSYELLVTIQGEKDPTTQMVIDFKLLKQIVAGEFLDSVDHSFIFNRNHPDAKQFDGYKGKTYQIDGEPTAENLIEKIASLIEPKLPTGCALYSLKLYETESSFVEWFNDTISR
ncbi:MAG: 6-carboxytetrahydropterin synthase [bacterium]|nr:6-carboxytetrahydropterin synthase [bacterium]